MVDRLLQHWQYPAHLSQDIRIDVQSTIPVAKGMASSTADIAATAIATAHYGPSTGRTGTGAALCFAGADRQHRFRKLTLFDHNNASTQIACETQPQLDLLVLESPETLRTADYHRIPRHSGLQAGAAALKRAWEKVQEACISQNPYRTGEAATLSAIASQLLLPKPDFDSLLALVEECDLYGVNVAHSGSVVGLMLDESDMMWITLNGCWRRKTNGSLAGTAFVADGYWRGRTAIRVAAMQRPEQRYNRYSAFASAFSLRPSLSAS